jgi:hypothetical protein
MTKKQSKRYLLTIMMVVLELSASIILFASPPPIPMQPAYAANQMPGETENLANRDDVLLSDSQRVVSGRNVYVVWDDDTSGNGEIFFTRSTDGGQTFEDKRILSNNAGGSGPHIAVSGRNVYVGWFDNSLGNFAVLFTRSTDGGQTFEEAQNIGENIGIGGPHIAVSGGNNVYVLFGCVTSPGNFDLCFTRSVDSGVTFDSIENISEDVGESRELIGIPKIAVSGGNNVYVVWSDNFSGLLFTRSVDMGESFGSIEFLTDGEGAGSNSQIAVFGGKNVYVVWDDPLPLGGNGIFFTRSTDGGQTFEDKRILSNIDGVSEVPQIAVSGRNVYVVWNDVIDFSLPDVDISFKRSTDFGQTFEDTRNLSDNTGISANPDIVVSGGNNVFVVWQDNTLGGFANIFFTRSTDRGETFGDIENLSNNNVEEIESFDPQIVVSGRDLYVIWTDAEVTATNRDIFFTSSSDVGQTFDDAQNLSNNVGLSQNPQIAVSKQS